MESDNTMALALTLINENRDVQMYKNYEKRQEYDWWRAKLFSSSGLGQAVNQQLVEYAAMSREDWLKHRSWKTNTKHMVNVHTGYRLKMQSSI